MPLAVTDDDDTSNKTENNFDRNRLAFIRSKQNDEFSLPHMQYRSTQNEIRIKVSSLWFGIFLLLVFCDVFRSESICEFRIQLRSSTLFFSYRKVFRFSLKSLTTAFAHIFALTNNNVNYTEKRKKKKLSNQNNLMWIWHAIESKWKANESRTKMRRHCCLSNNRRIKLEKSISVQKAKKRIFECQKVIFLPRFHFVQCAFAGQKLIRKSIECKTKWKRNRWTRNDQ